MTQPLTAALLVSLALALPAQASCYVDYKAKQDAPLRLAYGVAEIVGWRLRQPRCGGGRARPPSGGGGVDLAQHPLHLRRRGSRGKESECRRVLPPLLTPSARATAWWRAASRPSWRSFWALRSSCSLNLPDANAFNAKVERIFVENDDLRAGAEIKLLEILAQSGTAFSEVLESYRVVIFVLLVFATALLLAALVFLVTIITLNRRISAIQRSGIQVSSLLIARESRSVYINDMEFQLTEAAIETLSVLAEARMDDEVMTGAQIEGVISGRDAAECDEAAGATRVKRLRDALGQPDGQRASGQDHRPARLCAGRRQGRDPRGLNPQRNPIQRPATRTETQRTAEIAAPTRKAAEGSPPSATCRSAALRSISTTFPSASSRSRSFSRNAGFAR